MLRLRSPLAPVWVASALIAACAPSARPAPRVAIDEAAAPPEEARPLVRWRAEVEGAAQLALVEGRALLVRASSGRIMALDLEGQPMVWPRGGDYTAVTVLASEQGRVLVAGERGGVAAFEFPDGAARGLVPLRGSPGALAGAYGDEVFVATGGALVRGGDREVRGTIAEDVGPLTALVPNGGSVLAASGRGVLSISLADGTVTALDENSPGAHSVTLDHQGLALATVVGRGLLRYGPDGDATRLEVPGAGELGALAFDAAAHTLYAVDRDAGGAVLAIDYLALIGQDPAEWQARAARPMRPMAVAHRRPGSPTPEDPVSVEISGAEYWPNRGEAEADYPADILWGFYPEEGLVFEGAPNVATATPAAVACAERSYEALSAFVADPPEGFFAALGPGVSSRFYLWVNDYSEASESFAHEVRPARFWYWARNPAVPGRVPGYWKWETTLTRDGVCHIPERAQVDAYLAERNAASE